MSDVKGSASAGNPENAATDNGTSGAAKFDWKATLGDNYTAHSQLIETKKWADPGAALNSYSELEKMVGRDKIALPGKDAKPEDYRKIYTALGLPEKPDDYDFAAPEGYAEYSKETADWFRNTAHKHGLTAAQAKGVHDEWIQQQRQAQAALAKKVEDEDRAADESIRTEWGGDYEKKLSAAQSAVQAFGLGVLETTEIEKVLGTSKLVKIFANIGEKMGTATLVDGKSSGFNSPESARAEATRLKADPEFNKAYLDREHPGHAEAVRRMSEINKRAYPENA